MCWHCISFFRNGKYSIYKNKSQINWLLFFQIFDAMSIAVSFLNKKAASAPKIQGFHSENGCTIIEGTAASAPKIQGFHSKPHLNLCGMGAASAPKIQGFHSYLTTNLLE
jgi:hypothetical protein